MSVVILNTRESIRLHHFHVMKWVKNIDYDFDHNQYTNGSNKIEKTIRNKVEGFNSEIFAEVILLKNEYKFEDDWLIESQIIYSPVEIIAHNAASIGYQCMQILSDVDLLFMAYDEAMFSDDFDTDFMKIEKEKKRWEKRTRVVFNKIRQLAKRL